MSKFFYKYKIKLSAAVLSLYSIFLLLAFFHTHHFDVTTDFNPVLKTEGKGIHSDPLLDKKGLCIILQFYGSHHGDFSYDHLPSLIYYSAQKVNQPSHPIVATSGWYGEISFRAPPETLS